MRGSEITTAVYRRVPMRSGHDLFSWWYNSCGAVKDVAEELESAGYEIVKYADGKVYVN